VSMSMREKPSLSEDIPDHRAVLVECRAGVVDRGRALGVPGVALVAHPLNAHRAAHGLQQQCRVDAGVAGVITPVGARIRNSDSVHLVQRESEDAGDSVACVMRFSPTELSRRRSIFRSVIYLTPLHRFLERCCRAWADGLSLMCV
jgi:hypothetical protein